MLSIMRVCKLCLFVVALMSTGTFNSYKMHVLVNAEDTSGQDLIDPRRDPNDPFVTPDELNDHKVPTRPLHIAFTRESRLHEHFGTPISKPSRSARPKPTATPIATPPVETAPQPTKKVEDNSTLNIPVPSTTQEAMSSEQNNAPRRGETPSSAGTIVSVLIGSIACIAILAFVIRKIKRKSEDQDSLPTDLKSTESTKYMTSDSTRVLNTAPFEATKEMKESASISQAPPEKKSRQAITVQSGQSIEKKEVTINVVEEIAPSVQAAIIQHVYSPPLAPSKSIKKSKSKSIGVVSPSVLSSTRTMSPFSSPHLMISVQSRGPLQLEDLTFVMEDITTTDTVPS